MPNYKDVCPLCGREFEAYDNQLFCSVFCQYHDCEKCVRDLCVHGHCPDLCVICEKESAK